MKIYFILLVLSLFTPLYAEVDIPLPKIKIEHSFTLIPKATHININNIDKDLSQAISRIKQTLKISSQKNTNFSIIFCHLKKLKSCYSNNQYIWGLKNIILQGLDDEYALLPIINNNNNKLTGIALAAESIQGWQYATDWLLESYNHTNSKYQVSLIHDYPSFKDRAIFSTENSPSLDYWKSRIDIAAKLRIKELSFSLIYDRKLSVNSVYIKKYSPQLFKTSSAYYKNPNLVNRIIKYGKLRGVSIIPTILHLSTLKLYRYYPSWTMPNGRAINWKAKEPQQFLDNLILTSASYEHVNKISIWADEGGVVDRQKYFLQAIRQSLNKYEIKTGKTLALRLMLTPVVSQAIRKNKISNLASLLPQNTSIDFYSGVSYLGEAGTYHIDSPKLWNDVLQKIGNNLEFSGVGFAIRSQFNKVDFPYTHYINTFMKEINNHSGKGEYIYLGESYKPLDETSVQYISHRLWSGLNTKVILKSDSAWLLNYPSISQPWEKMMKITFLSNFQRFRMRRNPKNPETNKNFNMFLEQAKSGENKKWISQLSSKIEKVQQALMKSPIPSKAAKGKESIKLSLLISKTFLEIRKLAEAIHLKKYYKNIQSSEDIERSKNKIIKYCKDTRGYKKHWKTVERSPHCSYLPLIKKM